MLFGNSCFKCALFLVAFMQLLSCSSTTLVSKTGNDFSQKRIATESLYEIGPNAFLRGEYASNYSLTESQISVIAGQMLSDHLFFADANAVVEKGQIVVPVGSEVDVIGIVSLKNVGDFFKIQTSKGTYLVKEGPSAKLKSKEEYLQEAVPATVSLSQGEEKKSFNGVAVDYFNHPSEKSRIQKIEWFCEKYPQYKKFESLAKNKQVTIGMTEHLLGLAWGKPSQVKEEENTKGLYRSFIYTENYQVITKNSVVRSWKRL